MFTWSGIFGLYKIIQILKILEKQLCAQGFW